MRHISNMLRPKVAPQLVTPALKPAMKNCRVIEREKVQSTRNDILANDLNSRTKNMDISITVSSKEPDLPDEPMVTRLKEA